MNPQLGRLLARPAPLEAAGQTESLTSWMFRLAHANGYTSYGDFLQNQGAKLSPLALADMTPDRWALLAVLHQLTGIPYQRLKTLSLDETLIAMTGSFGGIAGRWLLSSGGRGCRYSICPLCLAQDQKTYWRGAWRLTTSTACPIHKQLLLDSCGKCGAPLLISGGRVHSLGRCETCGQRFHATPGLNHVSRISKWRTAPPNRLLPSQLPVRVAHTKLWWDGVRVLLNVLARPRLALKLQDAGLPRSLGPILGCMSADARLKFDRQPVSTRHQMLNLVDWLTTDWPARFIKSMNNARITCNEYAIAEIPVPYWLWCVCKEHLDRKRYRITAAEVSAATNLFGSDAPEVSKVAIKRLLGVTEGKAIDVLHPTLTRRLSDKEMLSVVELLNADLAATVTAREQRASLLRDACSIAVAAWLGISLRAASSLNVGHGQTLLQEWRLAARADDTRGQLGRSYLAWMECYLQSTRARFERYERPQSALFLSRFGVPTHGFGLAARFANLLRRCGIAQWQLGSRLLTARPASYRLTSFSATPPAPSSRTEARLSNCAARGRALPCSQ